MTAEVSQNSYLIGPSCYESSCSVSELSANPASNPTTIAATLLRSVVTACGYGCSQSLALLNISGDFGGSNWNIVESQTHHRCLM